MFDDCNEDHSSGVSKKPNVRHPTSFGFAATLSYGQGSSSNVNESLTRALDADKHEFCEANVASQVSLADTSSSINDPHTQPLPRKLLAIQSSVYHFILIFTQPSSAYTGARPYVCVPDNTNLRSLTTYALTDDSDERTSTKGVDDGAI
ncbi:hypothetical protein Tco_0970088 [Tanacetum coccineum]